MILSSKFFFLTVVVAAALVGTDALSISSHFTMRATSFSKHSSNVTLAGATIHGAKVSSNSTHDVTIAARQGESLECSIEVSEAGWESFYNGQSLLTSVRWTANGNVTCSIPMDGMTFSITANNSETSGTVAGGVCVDCAELEAVNTKYNCTQAPVQGICDGAWDFAYQAVLTAPPGFELAGVTGSCVAEGLVLTCGAEGAAGEILLFNFPNIPITLPQGVAMPVLTSLAIKGIRATHFPPNSDPSKGTFLPQLTDGDLGTIFWAGLQDATPFVSNSDGTWQKIFHYSGVGSTSLNSGALPATQITLVTDGHGGVNTMYPGPN